MKNTSHIFRFSPIPSRWTKLSKCEKDILQTVPNLQSDYTTAVDLITNGKPAKLIKFEEFSPNNLFNEVNENKDLYPKTKKTLDKFNGLCDIIRNYITHNNIISDNNGNFKQITSKALEQEYNETHLLNSGTWFQKLVAVLFKVYPSSILSSNQYRTIIKKLPTGDISIDYKILNNLLTKVKEGEYIKFCVFHQSNIFTINNGHSMLIKRSPNDKFIFFDPRLKRQNL